MWNDYGSSAQQTADGGYIITGTTNSFGAGGGDAYLIKTDSNGNSVWTKTFGGISGDNGYSVQQTSDGGYIVVGNSGSFSSGSPDVYLIKTDTNGNALWSKAYGGIDYDQGNSVQQTTDGGYIIAGYTRSFGVDGDVYLIKTDANGDSLWTKTFGGANDDEGYSIQQTTDGGYIITGHFSSFGAGYLNLYLIKTDANGDMVWSKIYGGPNGNVGYSVHQTLDGGYIIAGWTNSFGAGADDVYLIKTDTNGNSLWTKTFGRTNNDWGYSVQQTSDGGYIVAGYSSFIAGHTNVYLIKTDTNGDTLWTKTFGGTNNDKARSVQQTTDGGYIITGSTNSFGSTYEIIYLIKTDSMGNSGCNQGSPATIFATLATQVTNPATIVTSPTTIVTTPATIVGSGGTVTTLCTTVGINQISNFQFPISISPNPSSGYFTITFPDAINSGEVQIFNAYGAKIFTQNIINTSDVKIYLKNIPEGIYFVKVLDGEKYFSHKIIIQQN